MPRPDTEALAAALEDLRAEHDGTEAADPVEAALDRLRAEVPPPAEAPRDASGLARFIDHTQLKPEATEADIDALCEEAARFEFAAACMNPCFVPRAVKRLRGTPVKVCTVVGFPLGATLTAVKAFEAGEAIAAGAEEVDMVLPIGMLKGGRYAYVEQDLRAVVEVAAHAREEKGRAVLVKVILETALLSDAEKAIACVLARRAGADFVKTSTGFSSGGATLADVALMRQMVGEEMGVKASSGVRTPEDARAMIAHGATRIGASGSVALVEGAEASASDAAASEDGY